MQIVASGDLVTNSHWEYDTMKKYNANPVTTDISSHAVDSKNVTAVYCNDMQSIGKEHLEYFILKMWPT